jgi:hypothetical protein
MKIAITVYPDDLAEADRVIHLLKGSRNLELDSYMGKAQVEKVFDKPVVKTIEALESEEMNGGPSLGVTTATNLNINPGFTACSRIGTTTKEALFKALPGSDPDHIRKKIGRTLEQTQELLQLLWERDLIIFDGEEYRRA